MSCAALWLEEVAAIGVVFGVGMHFEGEVEETTDVLYNEVEMSEASGTYSHRIASSRRESLNFESRRDRGLRQPYGVAPSHGGSVDGACDGVP
jgi:hypothetical protein